MTSCLQISQDLIKKKNSRNLRYALRNPNLKGNKRQKAQTLKPLSFKIAQ